MLSPCPSPHPPTPRIGVAPTRAPSPASRSCFGSALLHPALLCAALLPAPVIAQQDTAAARPFVERGVYDKPYQTRLLGRTILGGYAEAHGRWERVDGATDEAGFEAKRFNLFTSTVVSDFVRMGAELEIEEGGEDITIEYAAIDLLLAPALAFRAGMILSPLGRFNLSHDSPHNEFTDRPLVSTDLLSVALSEAGMGFFGTFPTSPTGRLTYEIYAVNGFGSGVTEASPDGTRIPFGRQHFEDGNASPAFVGRLAFSPEPGLEIGMSAHHGAYNVFREEGVEVADRRDVSLVVADFEATVVGVRLAGEAAWASVDVPPAAGVLASSQRGFYAEASYDFAHGLVATMPRSFLTAKLRVDAVDFDADRDGDSVRQLTAGLNFRATSDTVLKLDYVRGSARDPFNSVESHAGLLVSLATYF